MYKDTIKKIENKLKENKNINPGKKKELLNLLSELTGEIEKLSGTDSEHANSIASYTEISAHEATRNQTNEKLLVHSINGLKTTLEGFEVSHPRLTEVVNSIAVLLSNMGI